MTEPARNSDPIPQSAAPARIAEIMRAVAAGEAVDLGGARIDADLLRRLIIGQLVDGASAPCIVTPFGVRIRNAEIIGRLDLEGTHISFPVALTRVTMQAAGQNGSILARDARIRRLQISNSILAGGIVADRAEFSGGIMIAGGRISGALLLRGSKIGGALAIEGTHLGDGKVAMLAAGAHVCGPLVLRRAHCHGEIRIQRTYLEAGLRADELQVAGDGAGIYCDAARIGGDVLLPVAEIAGPVRFENTIVTGGFTAPGMIITGQQSGFNGAGLEISQSLDFTGAKFAGSLILEGAMIGKRFFAAEIEIDGGETAIAADIIRIGGNWEMPRARLVGQIRIPGARIGGQLRCTAMRIYGDELSVRGDGAHVDGGVFFSRAVIVGCVRFPAAEIGNQFRLSGATLKVASGVALLMSGAILRRDAELNAGFQTVGGIHLDQIKIHGNCDLTASHIKSAAIVRAASGPAGSLVPPLASAPMSSTRPPADDLAVSLVDSEIDRLEMPSRADERPKGIVDLSRAHIGAYVDWAASWPPPANSNGRSRNVEAADYLILDGFTYEHLENPAGIPVADASVRRRRERAGQHRISWLLAQGADDTANRFKPQAWVYLARQLTAQGLDRDARLITIERRRRERMSRWSTPSARWESRFLDWFALYGFNPWRTVIWMAAVVILFAGIWAWSASKCAEAGCFDETVFVTSKRDAFSAERFTARYPAFHPLAYSFDVFVPFVSFGYEDHWRPSMAYQPLVTWRVPHLPAFIAGETDKQQIFSDVTITTGGALYVLVIIEKILGLILTSLMVTGFTGLLRSHE